MGERFLHEALLRARLELGLTQDELASSVGVDVRTYRRYESGEVNEGGFSVRQPARRRLLARLCAELGLAQDELVQREDASTKATPATSATAPAAIADAATLPLLRPEIASVLQRAPFFVGREELLDELLPWAQGGPGPGVLALVGVGGAGKSAVAERLLARLGGAGGAGLLVWSFYDDERTEAFLARAARYFSRGEAGAGEPLATLEAALAEGPPHLLVLDGLERVQADGRGHRAHGELEDPLLRRLLVALARGLGGARALVTSRFTLSELAPWEGQGARTVGLAPLCAADARRLLVAWGAGGDGEALQSVIDATGGHALSLAVAGSYAGSFLGGDLRPLAPSELAEAAHDDPLARRLTRLLEAYAGAIPEVERDLLTRLSALASGADERSLLTLSSAPTRVAGALAGLGAAELRRALVRLERLGLVFRAGEAPLRWSSHPFVRDHFRARLGGVQGEVRGAVGATAAASLGAAPGRGGGGEGQLDALEEILGQLLDAGQPEQALRLYQGTLGGFNRLGLVLGEMSRGARMLRRFSAEHLARLDAGWRSLLLYDQGLYAGALGDLEHGQRCYERYLELALAMDDPGQLATGLRTLAYTLRLRGRLPEARAAILRSCAVAEARGLAAHGARGLALLASIEHDGGEIAAAREGFSRVRDAREAGVARRGLWEAEHRLALGDREGARGMTEVNVEVCERLRWAGHAAHGRVLLGLAALPGDPARAARMLEAARPWAIRSGEVEMMARIHELAALVALARGAHFEALREVVSGEALAETCGLGLFLGRFLALSLRVARARGDEEGMARAPEVVARLHPDDAWGRAEALHEAGACEQRRGDPARAEAWLREALALRTRLGHPDRDTTAALLAHTLRSR